MPTNLPGNLNARIEAEIARHLYDRGSLRADRTLNQLTNVFHLLCANSPVQKGIVANISGYCSLTYFFATARYAEIIETVGRSGAAMNRNPNHTMQPRILSSALFAG